MNETKKKIPLALALCAAAVLSSLASLLTDLTTPYSNLSWSLHNLQSFFYPHSPRRILFMSIPSNSMVDTPFYLLLTLIISLLPLVMAVLLWKHRTKNQRKPVRVLCLVIAAAYLVRLVLNLVTMVMTPGSFELMNLAISLCTLLPMVIVIYTFLWAAGCIKKWMVKRGFVYVLLFYVLSGAWVLFTLLPPLLAGYAGPRGLPLKEAVAVYLPALIAVCLPTAIIDPEKARPVTQISAVVLFMVVLTLFLMPSRLL